MEIQSKHAELLNANALEATRLLSSMANPDRLLLLCMLVDQELNVSQLKEATGIEQPTLSQQLTVLRKDKLVQTRKEGKYVYYRLENPIVLKMMATLYEIFCEPLKNKS